MDNIGSCLARILTSATVPNKIIPINLWFDQSYRYFVYIQLSLSSRGLHGGAYFSDVSGWKSIPISVPGPYECLKWHRLLGFCLTITFCLIPAHQAVSLWNCHWNWRISRLEDHKYFPAVKQIHTNKTNKSFNKHGNFKGKRPGVLDLNKKWSWDKNQVAYCILGTYTVLGH